MIWWMVGEGGRGIQIREGAFMMLILSTFKMAVIFLQFEPQSTTRYSEEFEIIYH